MEIFSELLAFCVGNSPITREISHTKASDAELWCFFLSAPEPKVGQAIESPVIWVSIVFIMTSL